MIRDHRLRAPAANRAAPRKLRYVKHDPAGRWDVREHIINWAALLPKLRTVVRTSYDGTHRMLFKRVDGDMRISQGVWRIEPTPRGSRLYYTALVAPNFPVPQFMVERTINSDLPTLLRAIKQASETDATRRPRFIRPTAQQPRRPGGDLRAGG